VSEAVSAPVKPEPAPRAETQPDGSVRITLVSAILYFEKPEHTLLFRAPRVMEIIELGDPLTWLFRDGVAMKVVDRPVLKLWFERLLVGHDADMVGREADAALGMLIEDVLLGFFQTARMRLNAQSAPSS
jgi:hypothetical protein